MSRTLPLTRRASFGQDLVAALVPEAVVDRLEVVDVQHQQGQDAAETPRALDLLLEAALEVAEAPGPGERVGDRSFAFCCRTVGSVPRQAVESTIGELRVRAARAWFIMDWELLRR